MAFSYGADLTVPLDYLRFRINDKEEEYAVYQDGELNYFIDKVTGTPTENDLDKIALRLLKQQLQEILRAPSRERAGQYEVYRSDANALSLAISELEEDIRKSSGRPSPSFGGVYKCEVKQNRDNESLVHNKFYDDRVYRDTAQNPDSFIHGG